MPALSLSSLFNAILFAVVGVLLFAAALILLAKWLPGNLWRRALEERDVSAAVILAAVALALGWIIAAAVH